jgi:hypothetical protein
MSANNNVTGDRERRCYEIRVRGPIGPTMMHGDPLREVRPCRDTGQITCSVRGRLIPSGVRLQFDA